MTTSCLEALASARKLCRTLNSAPSPHARAKDIYSELARAEGWSSQGQEEIIAFGAWLATRPDPLEGMNPLQCPYGEA